MDAIEALKSQLKSKRAAFLALKEKAAALKKLHAEVALLPAIQADLVALERSLAILQGEDVHAAHENMNRLVSGVSPSAAIMVESILEEAGKPMTLEQIMPLLRVKGASFAEATVRGSLYRYIRKAQRFKLVGPGKFALRKWAGSMEDMFST